MRFRSLGPVVLVGMISLAACTEQVAPTATLPPGEAALNQTALTDAEQYLVRVSGPMSAFENRVASLGGRIIFAHAPTSIAVVGGLNATTAESLRRSGTARAVVADAEITMNVPLRGEPVTMEEEAIAEETETKRRGGGNKKNETESGVEEAEVAGPLDPAAAAFFARQWHHQVIEAPQAWSAGRLGSPDVTVAILDTGLDYTNIDLQGLVDLSRSASFVPSDDALVASFFPGAHPVADLHWHGTHVGATVSSNAIAAAGVTSQVTLVGVKVCSVAGGCPLASIVSGFLHAVDAGADVINMSLGGATLRAGNGQFISFVNSLFGYANQAGVTVVVAAGNNASDLDRNFYWIVDAEGEAHYVHFPSLFATYCDVPSTLCISASGPTSAASINGPWTNVDAPAPYTNFGRSAISVAAPGGTSGGLVWAGCSRFSLILPICSTDNFILGAGGTSMASPHAAGLAALLVEDLGRNPGPIKSRIQSAADDVGAPGVDPYSGKGRINVARALGL